MIKSRRLRWAGHLNRIEEGRSAFKILASTPIGKRRLGNRGLDGKNILEWILNKKVSIRGIGLIRPRICIIGEHL